MNSGNEINGYIALGTVIFAFLILIGSMLSKDILKTISEMLGEHDHGIGD